ncbi:MAG TPA: VWA domain-containing protein [Chroococcales cyanobacterium]
MNASMQGGPVVVKFVGNRFSNQFKRLLALTCLVSTLCSLFQSSNASTLAIVPHKLVFLPPTKHENFSKKDLSKLATHDVVLIIDKSHSMSKKDCLSSQLKMCGTPLLAQLLPSYVSRWNWCREQTVDLAKKTFGFIPNAVKVVLFSGNCHTYENADSKTIEALFSENEPKGATKTTEALRQELDQYFERKNQSATSVKPLLIAVITDGCPDQPYQLRSTIIKASQQMTRPEEVSITFLQVGNDTQGSKLLTDLDENLVAQNAQYDIVDVRPFSELRQIGLARALVNEIAMK